MRTQTEIDTEIEALENLKKTVPSHSFFGESNIDAIEAQIETLREKHSEEDVHDLHDGASEDELLSDERNRDNALEAARWLHGDEDKAPSSNWLHLAK